MANTPTFLDNVVSINCDGLGMYARSAREGFLRVREAVTTKGQHVHFVESKRELSRPRSDGISIIPKGFMIVGQEESPRILGKALNAAGELTAHNTLAPLKAILTDRGEEIVNIISAEGPTKTAFRYAFGRLGNGTR